MNEWRPMSTAPKDATDVEVKLRSGEVLTAHYAQDLSGEHQPAFIGWFEAVYSNGKVSHFAEIDTPITWRPLSQDGEPSAEGAHGHSQDDSTSDAAPVLST